jgi:hypothetical protein
MDSTNGSSAQDPQSLSGRWLVLIAQLPAKPDYLRVKLRRRIQRVGALSLRGGVYVLPDRDEALEDFTWLRDELIHDGGDAIVCAARTVIGITDADLEDRFRALRAADYRDIVVAARAVGAGPAGDEAGRELSRLRRRVEEIAKLDFFQSPVQADARRALDDAAQASQVAPRTSIEPDAPIAGRVWVTRSGVFVDRMASAWLILRFIDPRAKFKFTPGATYSPQPGELRFDMYRGEYTHDGNRCTFETLLDRFGLSDPALRAISEIVHDIDCKDERFARPEAAGIELVVRGLVDAEADDARRIELGGAIFDGLLAQFRARTSAKA